MVMVLLGDARRRCAMYHADSLPLRRSLLILAAGLFLLFPRGFTSPLHAQEWGVDGRCYTDPDHPLQRFVDCGNGTVTDVVTGIIWLQDSRCLGGGLFIDMTRAAQSLQSGDCNLSDSSVQGQWQLPTIAEWQATIEVSCMDRLNFFWPTLTDNQAFLAWVSTAITTAPMGQGCTSARC